MISEETKAKIDIIDVIAIKPCPFCGRKATIVSNPGREKTDEYMNDNAGYKTWYVGCSFPFFEGYDSKPGCQIKPSAKWYAKLSDAIDAWNTRS